MTHKTQQGVLGLVLAFSACSALATDFNITTDANFDTGIQDGVNHDSPNINQLQIDTTGTTFPVLWIANGGEDTVSRIDVDGGPDSEGCEVGRYQTWFGPTSAQAGFINHFNNPFTGPAPSRTAVDGDGDVYVANRFFNGIPGVMKILRDGGIDRNGNGVIDTSQDLNGDCMISRDPADGEIIPIEDTNGNGKLDPGELADERVVWYGEAGTVNELGRSLCIAPSGNIWLGMFAGGGEVFELDPDTGSVISGPHAAGNIRKYGCAIDADGIMYSATISSFMEIFDTNTKTHLASRGNVLTNYGMTIGNGGKVYLATNGGSGYAVYDPNFPAGDTDPANGTFTNVSGNTSSRGIGVDGDGNIFVGRTSLQKFDADNNSLGLTPNAAGTFDNRGVIVDANQDVWMVNKGVGSVSKLRNDGTFVKVQPVGNQPYTYSDATGIGFRTQTDPTGIFSIVLNEVDAIWDALSYNNEPQGMVPTGASIEVEARVADTAGDLALASFIPVANGATNLGLDGDFIEVRATLRPNPADASPVLSDLLVSTRSAPARQCDVNADGIVNRSDITLISRARGQASPPASSALDANGDGQVTVNDARFCVLRCDQPRCR